MVLDVIILAFFLLFVIIGLKRGAAKTLLNLIGLTLSVFLASTLGATVSQWIYCTFFQKGIIQSLNSAMAASEASDILQNSINALPDYVYSALSYAGIDKGSLLSQTAHTAETSRTAIAQTVEGIINPVLTSIISFFSVIILFLLLMILFKLLSKLLSNIFELPGFHMINRLLGAVLGLAESIVFVYLMVVLIKLILPFSGDEGFITQQMIDQSNIFRAMYNLNLFSELTQLSDSILMLAGGR